MSDEIGIVSENVSIWFMPWEASEVEFRLGPVIFWPFYRHAAERIPDDKFRQQLERYFDSYVHHQGRPAKSVTICSHMTYDFRPLNLEEISQIRAAVDALVFCTIGPANASAISRKDANHIVPPSADRYDLMWYNFTLGYEHFTIFEGRNNHFGWKVGEVIISRPWCLGGDFVIGDHCLSQALTNLFNSDIPNELRSRLFRSLEWFRLAHTDIHQVSVWSKVVMMATAFETLLDVQNGNIKKKPIAKRIHEMCVRPDSMSESRIIDKGKNQSATFIKAAWFIWDFYELRNSVVHGDILHLTDLGYPSSNGTLSQLNIADAVFLECFERELCVNTCYKDVINWFLPWEPNYTAVHMALGWSQ